MSIHEKHCRCLIGHDQSSHRYLFPYGGRKAWDEWRALPEDGEERWKVPGHIDAIRIDGAFVHFCCPTVLS